MSRGAEAVHRNVDQSGELAGELLDMNAGAPVDLGRVLASQHADSHRRQTRSTDSCLPITTMPFSETVKRLASRSRSSPMVAPAGMITCLSMIALRTTAPSPTSTP